MKLISTLLLTLLLALPTAAHSSEKISNQSVYSGNDLHGLSEIIATVTDSSVSGSQMGPETKKGQDGSAWIFIVAIGNKALDIGINIFPVEPSILFPWIIYEPRSLRLEVYGKGGSHVSLS